MVSKAKYHFQLRVYEVKLLTYVERLYNFSCFRGPLSLKSHPY